MVDENRTRLFGSFFLSEMHWRSRLRRLRLSAKNSGWTNQLYARVELHRQNKNPHPYFLRTKSNKKPGTPTHGSSRCTASGASQRCKAPPGDPHKPQMVAYAPGRQAATGSIKSLSGMVCWSVLRAGNKKYPSVSGLKGMYQL